MTYRGENFPIFSGEIPHMSRVELHVDYRNVVIIVMRLRVAALPVAFGTFSARAES